MHCLVWKQKVVLHSRELNVVDTFVRIDENHRNMQSALDVVSDDLKAIIVVRSGNKSFRI